MTSQPAQTVELTTGSLNEVADAQIGVMIVDGPRIRLGVVEPDGSEHVQWYTEDQIVSAAGFRWRLSLARTPDAPGSGRVVATLTRLHPGQDQ